MNCFRIDSKKRDPTLGKRGESPYSRSNKFKIKDREAAQSSNSFLKKSIKGPRILDYREASSLTLMLSTQVAVNLNLKGPKNQEKLQVLKDKIKQDCLSTSKMGTSRLDLAYLPLSRRKNTRIQIHRALSRVRKVKRATGERRSGSKLDNSTINSD